MTSHPLPQAATLKRPPSAAGYSMVELLVALALGALLLLGIVQVFTGNSAAYRLNAAQTRAQEAGRYAAQVLARDLRMDRITGCSSLAMDQMRQSLNTVACSLMKGTTCATGTSAIGTASALGYSASSVKSGDLSDLPGGAQKAIKDGWVGGDVLVSWGVTGDGFYAENNILSEARNEPITLLNASADVLTAAGLAPGHLALITDCVGSDVFSVTGEGNTKSLGHTDERNKDATLSRAYNWREITNNAVDVSVPGPSIRARVFPFDFRVYFICCVDQETGETQDTADNVTKNCRAFKMEEGASKPNDTYDPVKFRPALCRWSASNQKVESLVMDVADLRVTYDGALNLGLQTPTGETTKKVTQQRLRDKAGDALVDADWMTTNNYWDRVDTVRIQLLATSTDEVGTAKRQYSGGNSLGDGLPDDRRIYEPIGLTVTTRATSDWFLRYENTYK